MKYLKIKSEGQIQKEAFTLLGASTKKGEKGKIGLYGSGNKYAVASLLRNNIMFSVFSGENEIKFTTKEKEYRGKKFNIILVDGKETSLTTEMGGDDWDDSFSYIREVYSNALDEEGETEMDVVEEPSGEKGFTCFFIQYTKEVKDFYKNIHNYFCVNNPNVLHSNNYGSIYLSENNELRLFRRGILCFNNKEKSLFNYNGNFEINESRVLKDEWGSRYRVGEIWQKCTDEGLIKSLLLGLHGGNAGFYEHKMEFHTFSTFSDAWHNAVDDMEFVGVEHLNMFEKKDLKGKIALPFEMLKTLRRNIPHIKILGVSSDDKSLKVKAEPSDTLVNKVIDAISLLYKTDYRERFREEPKINYVKFKDSHTRAEAENGEIYLSINLDSYSVDEIAKILIEENEHNLTGFGDKTREFQDHLFNLYFEKLTKKDLVV